MVGTIAHTCLANAGKVKALSSNPSTTKKKCTVTICAQIEFLQVISCTIWFMSCFECCKSVP
jgi:hypothetical protein